MADIPKLDLTSKDIAAEKVAQLKALFPEIFTEGDKIDVEKLRLTLGENIDTDDERFGLHWAGKKQCFSIIQEASIGTLKPAKEESVNWDDTENLFIEGDNLEVLKLLQKSYYGKVKMIYIDPPYNTGKEFIYPDKYQENIDTYLAYTGQVDDDGYKFSTNSETEGRYHSNWLNMMYSRLFLARNLLQEDGVIYISIDDNELQNLQLIMNEIYGEENFIGTFIINSSPSAIDYGHIAKMHDYALFYAKNITELETEQLPDKNKKFKYSDDIGNFNLYPLYNGNVAFNPKTRPNLYYPFYLNPNKKDGEEFYEIGLDEKDDWIEVYPVISKKDGIQRVWRWGKPKSRGDLNKELVGYKTDSGEFRIVQKTRLTGKMIRSLLVDKEVSSRRGTGEVEKLFGSKVFSFPKPTNLIERFVKIAVQEGETVLDFFAGSATSAHAIMNLNADDGKQRNFIMVQLPEPIEEKSTAANEGFSNIAELGEERVRKAIGKIKSSKSDFEAQLKSKLKDLKEMQALKAKTPELFQNGKSKDLEKLEDAVADLKTKITNIENTDLGFKVFKLDKSNFKIWDGSVDNDLPKQIQMAIDHVNPDSSEEDILFEILLKAGKQLTVPIEELNLSSKKVFSIEGGDLLVCLEKELNEDLIRAIATKEPARVVCLDSGFRNNDQLKTNAVQIMKSHNVHDFRTV